MRYHGVARRSRRSKKPDFTEQRQHAHAFLDRLPEEELTKEDRRAVAASREYFRQNPEGGLSVDQVAAECGFTMDQVRNHQGESESK